MRSVATPSPPGVRALTTIRTGGISHKEFASLNLGIHVEDEQAHVLENRRLLKLACGLPAEPVWLRQTHSSNVAREQAATPDNGTDALITSAIDNVAAVLTADCLPVLFSALDGSEVAAAHAGWRGLCDGILESTAAAMSTPVAAIQAWFGPAISQEAFEVGAEVREQFVANDPDAGQHFAKNDQGRYQADLYGLARQRLQRLGIAAIYGAQYCTYSDPARFFSYRRDGRCGRMASCIFRG